MSLETLAVERVAKGADLLDKVKPDWYQPENLDLSILNIDNVLTCPLGQTFEDYFIGLAAVFPDGFDVEAPYEHGFADGGDHGAFFNEWLERCWTETVNARRNGQISIVPVDPIATLTATVAGTLTLPNGTTINLPANTPLVMVNALVEANS